MPKIKEYTKNINSNIYLAAAEVLGISYEEIDGRIRYYRFSQGNKELNLFDTTFSFNDSVAYRLVMNKYATSRLLEKQNIPVPGSSLFDITPDGITPDETEAIIAEAKKMYPVVIKPHNLSLGKGVFVNLKTEEDLRSALNQFSTLALKKLMLEEFVSGTDYRIITLNGKVIDIVERVAAFVSGDGKSNLNLLIENKNKVRAEQELPLIVMDAASLDFLSRQGLDPEHIPGEGRKITLKGVSNIAAGGETKRINLNSVPEQNLELFARIGKEMRLFLAGIDLIANDVTKDIRESGGKINEVNSNPHPDVNYFADMELSLGVAKIIFKEYFGI